MHKEADISNKKWVKLNIWVKYTISKQNLKGILKQQVYTYFYIPYNPDVDTIYKIIREIGILYICSTILLVRRDSYTIIWFGCW